MQFENVELIPVRWNFHVRTVDLVLSSLHCLLYSFTPRLCTFLHVVWFCCPSVHSAPLHPAKHYESFRQFTPVSFNTAALLKHCWMSCVKSYFIQDIWYYSGSKYLTQPISLSKHRPPGFSVGAVLCWLSLLTQTLSTPSFPFLLFI